MVVVFAFSCVFYFLGVTTSTFAHWEDGILALLGFFASAWKPDFEEEFSTDVMKVYVLLYLMIVALLLISVLLAVFVEVARKDVEAGNEALLAKAEMVAGIENCCSAKFLNKVNMTVNFDDDVTFDDELEKSPKGGLVDYKPTHFKSPGFDQRGVNNRIERYDSEEGPEMPWPLSELVGAQTAGEEEDVSSQSLVVAQELEKELRNLRGPLNRLMRLVKAQNKKGAGTDHSDTDGDSETQSNGDSVQVK